MRKGAKVGPKITKINCRVSGEELKICRHDLMWRGIKPNEKLISEWHI